MQRKEFRVKRTSVRYKYGTSARRSRLDHVPSLGGTITRDGMIPHAMFLHSSLPCFRNRLHNCLCPPTIGLWPLSQCPTPAAFRGCWSRNVLHHCVQILNSPDPGVPVHLCEYSDKPDTRLRTAQETNLSFDAGPNEPKHIPNRAQKEAYSLSLSRIHGILPTVSPSQTHQINKAPLKEKTKFCSAVGVRTSVPCDQNHSHVTEKKGSIVSALSSMRFEFRVRAT